MSPSYFAATVGLQMKLNWLSTLDEPARYYLEEKNTNGDTVF